MFQSSKVRVVEMWKFFLAYIFAAGGSIYIEPKSKWSSKHSAYHVIYSAAKWENVELIVCLCLSVFLVSFILGSQPAKCWQHVLLSYFLTSKLVVKSQTSRPLGQNVKIWWRPSRSRIVVSSVKLLYYRLLWKQAKIILKRWEQKMGTFFVSFFTVTSLWIFM